MNRSTAIIKFQTEYIVVAQQSLNLNCESEENLHLLAFEFHVTQNKFATRILLIFHKCSTMPTTPAERPMYMDLIQKLPLIVSCVVVLLIQYCAKVMQTPVDEIRRKLRSPLNLCFHSLFTRISRRHESYCISTSKRSQILGPPVVCKDLLFFLSEKLLIDLGLDNWPEKLRNDG